METQTFNNFVNENLFIGAMMNNERMGGEKVEVKWSLCKASEKGKHSELFTSNREKFASSTLTSRFCYF